MAGTVHRGAERGSVGQRTIDRPCQVLVIEDSESDAELIRAVLEERFPGRYRFVRTRTLHGGLAVASGVDCVLLDLALPDATGLGGVVALKHSQPEVPVIVLTGSDDEDLGERALQSGAQDFLVKGRASPDRVDRSLRYGLVRQLQHSRLTETLVHGLLPDELPAVDGLSLAARYEAGDNESVGGDWYDVLVLSGGDVALLIGDVAGHGLQAAAAMAQLRNALRAYVLDRSPGVALSLLNRLTRELLPNDLATAAVAVVNPASGRLRLASAGHPPVLLLAADGSVSRVTAPGTALGALHEAVYEETNAVLGSGATLLLYTDGLVESRDENVERALDRVAAELATMSGDVTELLDHLVAVLPDPSVVDDVTLLAGRRLPTGGWKPRGRSVPPPRTAPL